jgi:uncharacterized protein YjbI with pentapeptide repeats
MANLQKTVLERADLRRAILHGIHIDETNLTGAIMPDGSIHE